MGDYTSFEDIRRLFKKVDTAGMTAEDQEFYIVMAESVVKGCISKRYTLPFTTVPTLIRYISTELALIYILDRFFTQEARSENSWVNQRREAILGEDGLLNQIKDGDIELVLEDDSIVAEDADKAGLNSDTETYTPTFGHGFVGNEEIDPDRLESEEDARD